MGYPLGLDGLRVSTPVGRRLDVAIWARKGTIMATLAHDLHLQDTKTDLSKSKREGLGCDPRNFRIKKDEQNL